MAAAGAEAIALASIADELPGEMLSARRPRSAAAARLR
jgi:hypothetical protein